MLVRVLIIVNLNYCIICGLLSNSFIHLQSILPSAACLAHLSLVSPPIPSLIIHCPTNSIQNINNKIRDWPQPFLILISPCVISNPQVLFCLLSIPPTNPKEVVPSHKSPLYPISSWTCYPNTADSPLHFETFKINLKTHLFRKDYNNPAAFISLYEQLLPSPSVSFPIR